MASWSNIVSGKKVQVISAGTETFMVGTIQVTIPIAQPVTPKAQSTSAATPEVVSVNQGTQGKPKRRRNKSKKGKQAMPVIKTITKAPIHTPKRTCLTKREAYRVLQNQHVAATDLPLCNKFGPLRTIKHDAEQLTLLNRRELPTKIPPPQNKSKSNQTNPTVQAIREAYRVVTSLKGKRKGVRPSAFGRLGPHSGAQVRKPSVFDRLVFLSVEEPEFPQRKLSKNKTNQIELKPNPKQMKNQGHPRQMWKPKEISHRGTDLREMLEARKSRSQQSDLLTNKKSTGPSKKRRALWQKKQNQVHATVNRITVTTDSESEEETETVSVRMISTTAGKKPVTESDIVLTRSQKNKGLATGEGSKAATPGSQEAQQTSGHESNGEEEDNEPKTVHSSGSDKEMEEEDEITKLRKELEARDKQIEELHLENTRIAEACAEIQKYMAK